MPFEVSEREEAWFISDGAARFGPYASNIKAEDSAARLNELRAWADLPVSEMIAAEPRRAICRAMQASRRA